jgi:hypothetical protein
VSLSRPIISPENSLPSRSETLSLPEFSITCAFVRISPSLENTNPEPVPVSLSLPPIDVYLSILTTAFFAFSTAATIISEKTSLIPPH